MAKIASRSPPSAAIDHKDGEWTMSKACFQDVSKPSSGRRVETSGFIAWFRCSGRELSTHPLRDGLQDDAGVVVRLGQCSVALVALGFGLFLRRVSRDERHIVARCALLDDHPGIQRQI